MLRRIALHATTKVVSFRVDIAILLRRRHNNRDAYSDGVHSFGVSVLSMKNKI